MTMTRAQLGNVEGAHITYHSGNARITIKFRDGDYLEIDCKHFEDLDADYGPTITTKPTLSRNERAFAESDDTLDDKFK